jgi:hypothetical protein
MAVSFVGFSTLQAGSAAAVAVTPPASTLAGDIQMLFMASKLSSTIPQVPTGFSLMDSAVVGTGTDGVGTGPIRLSCWSKELAAAGASVNVSNTGGNVFLAGGCAFRKAAGEYWNCSVNFGSDTSSGTAFSAAVPNMGLITGDFLYYFGAVTANTTRSVDSITATGATLAAITGTQSGGTATGNAMYSWEARTNVTAGQQTGTATATATHAAATTGGILVIRASVAQKPVRQIRHQALNRSSVF